MSVDSANSDIPSDTPQPADDCDISDRLVIVTDQESESKTKIIRKRRRSNSSNSSDDEKVILPENAIKVEEKLSAIAARNNLTTENVKKILKRVVLNEHVLAIVKLREEEVETNKNVFEPKLTRSKTKILKNSTSNVTWPLPITPVKISETIPPIISSIIKAEVENDIHSVAQTGDKKETTETDIDSQLQTSLESADISHINAESSSPFKLSEDGLFKIPKIVSFNQLTESPSHDLSFGSGRDDVDIVWKEFINDSSHPLLNNVEEDDEADPEYHVTADPVDEEELLSGEPDVEVSTEELSELFTELIDGLEGIDFNIIDVPLVGPNSNIPISYTCPDEIHLNNTSPIKLLNISKSNPIYENNLQNFGFNCKEETKSYPDNQQNLYDIPTENVIDIEKCDIVFEPKVTPHSYQNGLVVNTNGTDISFNYDNDQTVQLKNQQECNPQIINLNINGNPTEPYSLHPISQNDNESPELINKSKALDTDNTTIDSGNVKSKESEKPRNRVTTLVLPADYEDWIFKSGDAQLLPSQREILDQQMRQHVQLITQYFLQVHGHPRLWKLGPPQLEFLMTLKFLSDDKPNSAFRSCNLLPAIELCESWKEKLTHDTEEMREMVKFVEYQNEKVLQRRKLRSTYYGKFPPLLKKEILNSTGVFLYPELLPSIPFRVDVAEVKDYLESEDQLIAIGLEQFYNYINANESTRSERGLRLQYGRVAELIGKYMMPWRPIDKLKVHIALMKNQKQPNSINYYYKHYRAPRTIQKIYKYDTTKPLLKHDMGSFPITWAVMITQLSSKKKVYRRSGADVWALSRTGIQRSLLPAFSLDESDPDSNPGREYELEHEGPLEVQEKHQLKEASLKTGPETRSKFRIQTRETRQTRQTRQSVKNNQPSPTASGDSDEDSDEDSSDNSSPPSPPPVYKLVCPGVYARVPATSTSSQPIHETEHIIKTKNTPKPIKITQPKSQQVTKLPLPSQPLKTSVFTIPACSVTTAPINNSSTIPALTHIYPQPISTSNVVYTLVTKPPPDSNTVPIQVDALTEIVKRIDSLTKLVEQICVKLSPPVHTPAELPKDQRLITKYFPVVENPIVDLTENSNLIDDIVSRAPTKTIRLEHLLKICKNCSLEWFSTIILKGKNECHSVRNIKMQVKNIITSYKTMLPSMPFLSSASKKCFEVSDDSNEVAEILQNKNDENSAPGNQLKNSNKKICEDKQTMSKATQSNNSTKQRVAVKTRRELEANRAMFLSNNPYADELKETLYAAAFMERVQTRLNSQNSESFQKFQDILNSFDIRMDTPIILYRKLEELFGEENADLLEEFLTFLTPGQASEVGKFMDHFMLTCMSDFIERLQIYFANKPAQLKKVLCNIEKLSEKDDSELTMSAVKSQILPLLKGNQYLTDWFKKIFSEESPPDSLVNSGYEVLAYDKVSKDGIDRQLDGAGLDYEVLDLPSVEENYGNDTCTCSCHDSTNEKFKNKIRHCLACGMKYIQGRAFVQHGRVLRGVHLNWQGDANGQIDQARRLSVPIPSRELGTRKAVRAVSIDPQTTSSKNDSDDERVSPKRAAKVLRTPTSKGKSTKSVHCNKNLTKSVESSEIVPIKPSCSKSIIKDDDSNKSNKNNEVKCLAPNSLSNLPVETEDNFETFDEFETVRTKIIKTEMSTVRTEHENENYECMDVSESDKLVDNHMEIANTPIKMEFPVSDKNSGTSAEDRVVQTPIIIKSETNEEESNWTRDEDKIILLILRNDNKNHEQTLSKIKDLLPHRTASEIHNRFLSVINLLQKIASGP